MMNDGAPTWPTPARGAALTLSPAIAIALCLLLAARSAQALQALDEAELGEVWGQALVEVQKRVGNGGEDGDLGLSFTRIRLGVRAEVNANIDFLELGNYDIPRHSSDTSNTIYYSTNKANLNADIRARNISMGCVQMTQNGLGQKSCGSGPDTVKLERPFIEVAYKNDGTASEELVGLRIGFELLNGWIGGTIESLSGHVYGCDNLGTCGESKAARSKAINALGINWDLSLLNRMQAINTKNFFFGLQKTAINYPRTPGSTAASQITAQPGFWINLRDGLTIPTGDIMDILVGAPKVDNCWRAATYC